MLESIDLLIGFTTVMLMVSMAVTMVTQFFISLLQRRSQHLRQGIADLLEQIKPGIARTAAESIAGAVLSHPLIRGSNSRPGTVVKREELTKLLLELGSGNSPSSLPANARSALQDLLKENGIANPEDTLNKIRTASLELEQAYPELAATSRHNLAILQEAKSQYVAKMNAWFDQTMDRVTERFTYSARQITVVSAAAVAIIIQLDTFAIVNRLSMDEDLRRVLVAEAVTATGASSASNAGSPGTAVDINDPGVRRYYDILNRAGLITVAGWGWFAHWRDINLFGVLLSIALLSLGAPFWYSSLQRLLQLRSTLADKEDTERKERQQQSAGPPLPPASPPAQPSEGRESGGSKP